MRGGSAIASGLLLALAVARPVAATDDLEAIRKGGRLRVLVVEGAPAFVSLAGGSSPGFEREMLDGFAKLHGIEVQLVEVPSWDVLIPSLLADKGHVIAGGVTDTPVRRRQIAFTSEVFPTRDVVLTRKPTPVVDTL